MAKRDPKKRKAANAKARETMLRLRREQPEKFAMGRRKKIYFAPEIKLETPAAVAVQTPPPPPPPEKATFMTVQPDSNLFGTENVPPPKAEQLPPPGSQPPGAPGATEQGPTGQHTTVLPKDTRALAVMVWTMILQLLAVLFGPAMFPRKVGNGPGEVPYDENEMVIGAWMDYFASIGLKPLSPVMNLLLSILAYMLPRAQFIVETVKGWFSPRARDIRNARKPTPDETPEPETPPEKTESPSEPQAQEPSEPGPVRLATREEAAAAAADFL